MKYWFKHDIYTVNDPKVMILLQEFGGIGYAFFWRIIESLYASESAELTIDPVLILSLANQLKTTTEHLMEILKRCVELDIFTQNIVSICPTNEDKVKSKVESKPLILTQFDSSQMSQNVAFSPKFDSMHLTSKRVKNTVIENTEKRRQFNEIQSMHGKKGGRPIEEEKVKSKGVKSQEVDLEVEKDKEDLRSKQLSNKVIEIRSKQKWSNFSIFWKSYPKRVAKIGAYKIWTTQKLDEKLNLILADLEKRKLDEGWKNGFIPHPTTYLSHRRWEDESNQQPRYKNRAEEIFEKNFALANSKPEEKEI